MNVLYITQPGAELRKHGHRLRVTFRGEVVTALPLREVQRVVLLAPVQVSAAAARALLAAGVPVVFCSLRGVYYGQLARGGEDVDCWLAQVLRWQDPDYRLGLARSIVAAKVRNQRSLLRRQARNHPHTELTKAADQISALLQTLDRRGSMDELRGVEGQASALYFEAFRICLRQEGVAFEGRNRRPPRDPVNALLSLGYMLCLAEVTHSLVTQGLNVGLGFLHEPLRRRPALALDLLEVWRQPIVDRLTLSLFNRGVFSPGHFQALPSGAVRLKAAELRRYLMLWERTLTTPFSLAGESTTYREMIRRQAAELRESFLAGHLWTPATWEL